MTDPYDPYGPPQPQQEPYAVEYEVVYPPLGQALPGPAPVAAPPPGPVGARPGAATAAAVLALVEAGLGLLAALVTVVLTAAGADLASGAVEAAGVLALVALPALLVLGALLLLRGAGRVFLLATTWVGAGLGAAWALWVVVGLAADGRGPAAVGALGAGLVALTLPVVRLVLLHRPAVRHWVDARSRPAAPPVWSPATGQWVAGRPPGGGGLGAGTVAAVAAPAVLLGVLAAVVLGTAGPPADPYAVGSPGGEGYVGTSSWGHRYYQGGRPLAAPVPGSLRYDPRYDAEARACSSGDMSACDDLYRGTPIGDFYEWFGSSCAGRLGYEAVGGCVDRFGPFAD